MEAIRHLVSLRRDERRAARFLVAYAQSSLGTWAGATAIVVLAYQRLHSVWAVTLILLADFVPGMVLGPLLGAAADRWPRRVCLIAADVARALAFLAIALVPSFGATLALATLAGAATALFTPAALASLPDLVEAERVPAMTAFYGVVADVGKMLGPLLAGATFALIGTTGVVVADAATFALSAAILAVTPFASRPAREPSKRTSLIREARRGLAVTARIPIVRVVLWASALTALFAAMMNVGELFLARHLGSGAAGYAVIVTVFGCGMVAGSAFGARRASAGDLRARYLAGILIVGGALMSLAVIRVFALTLPAFALAGIANGLVMVHQRLLIQALVPDAVKGRAFAALETLLAWGFVASFLAGGALVASVGAPGLMAVAGGGCVIVRIVAGRAMAQDASLASRAEAAAIALAEDSAALLRDPVPAYAGAPTPPGVDEASIAARTASV